MLLTRSLSWDGLIKNVSFFVGSWDNERMNLAQSMIYVLKHRKRDIINNFWKQDMRPVFKGIPKETLTFFKKANKNGLKETFSNIKDSTVESVVVFKDLPSRIRQGFQYFHEDLLREMEALQDNQQKTVFCLKVIASLCSYTLGSVQGFRHSGHQLHFKGLKLKSAMLQVMATEILVKVSQVFVLRLLEEVEGHLDSRDEIKKISMFKQILSGSQKISESENAVPETGDPALRIVESFRIFLMTGERRDP
jgi:hypothetical protein